MNSPKHLTAATNGRTSLVRMLGADARLSANDEPEPFTEDDLLAGDRARNDGKAERAADREFAEAMRLQMRANDVNDVIARR